MPWQPSHMRDFSRPWAATPGVSACAGRQTPATAATKKRHTAGAPDTRMRLSATAPPKRRVSAPRSLSEPLDLNCRLDHARNRSSRQNKKAADGVRRENPGESGRGRKPEKTVAVRPALTGARPLPTGSASRGRPAGKAARESQARTQLGATSRMLVYPQ